MSNKRRSRPTRYRRPEQSGELVSVITGWCDGPDTLEEAKQQTHDTVIRLLGDRRTLCPPLGRWPHDRTAP